VSATPGGHAACFIITVNHNKINAKQTAVYTHYRQHNENNKNHFFKLILPTKTLPKCQCAACCHLVNTINV